MVSVPSLVSVHLTFSPQVPLSSLAKLVTYRSSTFSPAYLPVSASLHTPVTSRVLTPSVTGASIGGHFDCPVLAVKLPLDRLTETALA